MQLLRCFSFICARYEFQPVSQHLSGKENVAADALSRNNMHAFFSFCPQANKTPIVVPDTMVDLLLISRPRLDISSLDRSVREFFSAGLAQSTARVYASANRRFLAFCNQYNFQPLPVSETLLCRYVSFLASQSLKYQSIKSYLSAVRYLQISHGLHNPFGAGAFPHLEYVLKGIRRSPSAPGSRARLPITPAILRGFHALWSRDNNNPDNTMLWAACCLGFFGFLRSGEFTVQSVSATDPPLLRSDIALDLRENPTVVSVKIHRSKTDPFRVGVSLYLGITKDIICPVKSLAAYLALRPKEDGPLFLWKEGSALTRDQLVREGQISCVDDWS